MTFDEAVKFLDDSIYYGIKPDLTRITKIAHFLEEPQKAYPVIHVTGTNGKTSTSRMIAAILAREGMKAGLYTSPHLVEVTERVVINGDPISEVLFAECMSEISPAVERVNHSHADRMTYFEILTALAFEVFRREKVNVAVIEVGMGGRWDATNIADGKVAVITNVGHDHSEYLGDSLEDIAKEKSYIIKKGAAAITAERSSHIIEILQGRCARVGARLAKLGNDFSYSGNKDSLNIQGIYSEYSGLELNLFGDYQLPNAALAVAATELFLGQAIKLPTLRRSLREVTSPGRLEVLGEKPYFVVDGAHNQEGAAALVSTIDKDFDFSRLIICIAVLGDKDYSGILKALSKRAAFIVLTRNSSPRCIHPSVLAEIVGDLGVGYLVEEDIGKAVKAALSLAGPKDLVLATGSLYTVGDVKAKLLVDS